MIPPLPRAYVDHLVSPRNRGDLSNAEAAGEVGSMVGGLGVRVTLSYRDAGRGRAVIGRAASIAFGSAAPVAPASAATEILVGRTPGDAASLTPVDLRRALGDGEGGELPPRVVRAAETVVEAVHRALGVPGPAGPSDPFGGGILVCRCLDVGDRMIRRAVADGATDPDAIGDLCGAGRGCGSCRSDLWLLVDEESHPPEPPPRADLHPIERIAWARVAPVLRAQGLGLATVRLDGDVLRIRTHPLRPRAEVSSLGAVAVARMILRDVVWDGLRVELAPTS